MRACAVEMHMDKAQEPFYAKFYEENAGPQTSEHLDQASPLTFTERTPQCGHTVQGKTTVVPRRGARS